MGFAFKSSDFTPTGIPLLRMGNLYQNTLDFERNPEYLPESFKDEYARFLVRPGDLVMSMTGTMGKRDYGFTVEIPSHAPDSLLNQRVMKFVPKKQTSAGYLLNLLRSEVILSRLYSFPGGTKQANLSAKQVQELVAPIPPYYEQKKIAKILSTWDKAITATEKLLANSQQQKKALMQQLLTGKKRLLDNNGVRFSGEWKNCQLGDIGEIKSAGVDKKIVENETPVRLLNFTDIFKRSFIYSDEINHWVTAPQTKVEGCNVLKGDIFFTPSSETRDEVGMSAVVAEDISDCCYSYHIVRFRIKEAWDLNFKAFAFSTPSFRKQVSLLADGSGQRYVVSQDGFRSILISYPSFSEQQAIGKALRLAEEEVIALQQKIDVLKQEKKALMQQLLTGKRRVKVEEAA